MLDVIEPEDLRKLGLLGGTELKNLAGTRQTYLVEDLMLKPSINILAGDSGLGKSPLAAQLAICVATGMPFLGHKVEDPGLVVYCDAESTPGMMWPMVEAISKHLGLSNVPENLRLWNPNWNPSNKEVVIVQNKVSLYNIVKTAKPKLVVIDSLRNYYPLSIKEQESAATMIKEMRKYCGEVGVSWLLIHHLRKKNREEIANNTRPTIKHDVHAWLEEVAGSFALINNTDLRLGWEMDRGGNDIDKLYLGGFLRVQGDIGPYKIIREMDEDGEPQGYRLATTLEQFNQQEQQMYADLPKNVEFTFTYLTSRGRSRSAVARFLKRAVDVGGIEIVREVPPKSEGGRPTKVYKMIPQKEEVVDEASNSGEQVLEGEPDSPTDDRPGAGPVQARPGYQWGSRRDRYDGYPGSPVKRNPYPRISPEKAGLVRIPKTRRTDS